MPYCEPRLLISGVEKIDNYYSPAVVPTILNSAKRQIITTPDGIGTAAVCPILLDLGLLQGLPEVGGGGLALQPS